MYKPRPGIAAAAVLACMVCEMSACANPQDTAAPSAQPSAVGTAAAVHKDNTIAAMVPAEMKKRGTFTAAVNPDVAPVKFINNAGKIAGLNPDLLRDAAKVMGLKVNLQRGTFDAMMPGLKAKRYDAIASIGDFKEREGQVEFIDYLITGTALVASADYSKDKLAPADLCGISVAYIRGTIQQGLIADASKNCTKRGKKKVNASAYGDTGAGLLAVKSGQADTFWGDSPVMLFSAKTKPKLYKVVYEHNNGYYGIGVNKDNHQFAKALHAALLKLVDEGVYKQLLAKWGLQSKALPKLPINAGPAQGS